ncbi:hypothetical protein LTR66_005759 [Elasticomyces elasticus]|nr:hypothetical protein LTR66_005759 [Elasticomyces elasticus]
MMVAASETASSPLLALPAELIHHILSFLPPTTLASVSATCRLLNKHTESDHLWQPFVNANLPKPLHSPAPAPTFRALFAAHHPHWFLPRHKIWFSDTEPSGKVIIARYDPRLGSITAHALAAERGFHTFELWAHDQDVIIHSFDPRVNLDLNQPVLKLDINSSRIEVNRDHDERIPTTSRVATRPGIELTPRLSREILMDCSAPPGIYDSFLLARPHPAAITSVQTSVWPPLILPSVSRTRNASVASYASIGHRPTRLHDVSTHNFRLRRWCEYTGRRSSPSTSILSFNSAPFGNTPPRNTLAESLFGNWMAHPGFSSSGGGMNVRIGDDVSTYATLPQEAYTPTANKPWRGIWCGDYSGHGCEFLVILQPEKEEEGPLPRGIIDGRMAGLFGGGGGNADDNNNSDSDSDESFASAQEVMSGSVPPLQALGVTNGDLETVSALAAGAVASGSSDRATRAAGKQRAEDDGYSGRLEAIKLTGDPNIPRGEHTFIAPDIGPRGLIRTATEETFRGARIVRSAGHIAARGFRDDCYTPTQLILISHNRLAQYWEEYGHVSYYVRVDIDSLLEIS